MASGSQLAIPKTHRHYVRGADEVKSIRDRFKKLCGFRTEDLRKESTNSSCDEKKAVQGSERGFDQTAKADMGKMRPTLVPRQIIRDIAIVRGYGDKKYGSSDNWKQVEIERYRDALCRHLLAYLDDPDGKDAESGLFHYQHLACNCAFICEMEKWRRDGKKMQ